MTFLGGGRACMWVSYLSYVSFKVDAWLTFQWFQILAIGDE
jgi:hypothetical protein